MVQLIIGFFIGIVTIWFGAINKLRFDIYKTKIDIYNKIQDISADILSYASPYYRDLLENNNAYNYYKCCLDLSKLLFKNIVWIPDNIYTKAQDFCTDYEWKNIHINSFKSIVDAHAELTDLIRADLHLDKINSITHNLLDSPKIYHKILKNFNALHNKIKKTM